MLSEYILIGADLVPTKSNIDLFTTGNRTELIGTDLDKIMEEASYRIFNLEVPLTDTEEPILKQGPNLIAPTKTIEGYKALGVDLFTLANNHILDQNKQGLQSTICTLDNAGISHLGAGKNLAEAAASYVIPFCGKQIGIYACAEHEFSIATENTVGANPFDPLWSLDHVAELKRNVDFVIVLYHGGKEHYRYPSPNLQKICRRLVDKGADLVICQHSHCIGCEEKYKDGTVVYGQGNFIFDDSDNECWQTAMLVMLDNRFQISYIPLVKVRNGVRLADKTWEKQIFDAFRKRSDEIKAPGFIEQQYMKFADEFLDFYLYAVSGKKTLLFRIINKLTKGNYMRKRNHKVYEMQDKVRITNYIDCEAHRELLLQALANMKL